MPFIPGKRMACFRAKKMWQVKNESETNFMVNGGMLLEKQVAFCNGRSSPFRHFSEEELKMATNKYDKQQIIKKDGFFKLYKWFLQDRQIIVKKFPENFKVEDFALNEIVYASQMSAHKNVLKFLGCCLETQCPVLVFEPARDKNLADCIHDRDSTHFQSIPWKGRLKIAAGIANVIVYLHTAFPRPIVHRNIKASNILLEDYNIAKLTDFSLAVPIPAGESRVKDIVAGTVGHIAPESLYTGYFNEKNDVYSFGVFLLVLLTGQRSFDLARHETGDEFLLVDHVKKCIETNVFKEMVDPIIVAEGSFPGKDEQLEAFRAVALSCIHDSAKDRPAMIEVAKGLRRILLSV